MDAFTIPSWYGWIVIALVSPGLIVLIGVAIAYLFHSPPPKGNGGPRQFHVLGFDPKTNDRRELTLLAEDRATARGLAQMQGVVVTDVTPVEQQPGPAHEP